ncbi:hypothetical protein BRD03_01200 [Halobacteriales archaeon QS_9_68_17]|nr:MAG: hypothetical protein BRD03_01200 [Halobacteriales archaeon QS_9_68_17]
MPTGVTERTTDAERDAAVRLLRGLRSHEDEASVTVVARRGDTDCSGCTRAVRAATPFPMTRLPGTPHSSASSSSELLGVVEAWVAERDCEDVALANRAGNDAALSFYEDEAMETWGYAVETGLCSSDRTQ